MRCPAHRITDRVISKHGGNLQYAIAEKCATEARRPDHVPTMLSATVPTGTRALEQSRGRYLEKAAAHAETDKIPHETLLGTRLFPEMLRWLRPNPNRQRYAQAQPLG